MKICYMELMIIVDNVVVSFLWFKYYNFIKVKFILKIIRIFIFFYLYDLLQEKIINVYVIRVRCYIFFFVVVVV